VPGAGHTIQSSNPRGLAAEVVEFLRRVQGGR
jgi:pimeloyl-ACP methyl ester carboxylesterase